MAIRKTPFSTGEYYHIYNRGNNKRKIFHDSEDYQHFLKILFLANSDKSFVVRDIGKDLYSHERGETLVSIGVYCLMPNHFHLLVTESIDGGISRFMQKLTTAYVMYYNTKYARTGSLFEGKFKSEHANNDRYLKYLFSYIHLNPLKLIDRKWKTHKINPNKAFVFLDTYRYSSYLDYSDLQRKEGLLLDKKPFPKYFGNVKSFKIELLDWITLSNHD